MKLFWEFYNKQDSHVWSFLLPTLLIYAHIRYESIMFSGFILIFLLITKKYTFKNIFEWSSVKLFMIGYFPQILQRILSVGKYENPADRAVLSHISVIEHGMVMLRSMLDFDGILPYNSFVNFLTPVLILCVFVYIWRRRFKFGENEKLISFLIFFGVSNTVLFLSHHAGLYDHPTQARFFFIYCIMGVALFMAGYFLVKLKDKERVLFITCLFMFLYFYPKAVEGRFMNKLVINRDLRSVYSFVESQNELNNLYIYNRPGQIIPLNRGAVNHRFAKKNWDKLKKNLELGLFSNIYVIVKDRFNNPEYTYFKDDVEEIQAHQSSAKFKLTIYKVNID
jgi:hypothetical protein